MEPPERPMTPAKCSTVRPQIESRMGKEACAGGLTVAADEERLCERCASTKWTDLPLGIKVIDGYGRHDIRGIIIQESTKELERSFCKMCRLIAKIRHPFCDNLLQFEIEYNTSLIGTLAFNRSQAGLGWRSIPAAELCLAHVKTKASDMDCVSSIQSTWTLAGPKTKLISV